MSWVFDDGGAAAAGYTPDARDCVPRSIAIASGLEYIYVLAELRQRSAAWVADSRSQHARVLRAKGRRLHPRSGVLPQVFRPWLQELGFQWVPAIAVGTGVQVHLRPGEMPDVLAIVRCSKHLTVWDHGVIRDVFDPSRDGTRAVYGWWTRS